MKNNLSILIKATLFLNALFISFAYSQDDVEDNKLKIETEPLLIYNQGLSVNALYSVTENNNFAVGLYLISTDIPNVLGQNMFNNFTDSTSARLSQEIAINLRYRLKISKNLESNPYVGLILGWENIHLKLPGSSDLDVSTFLVTPHVGYEFYIYKKMVYLNPQLRSVFYLGQQSSDVARAESLKSYLILPSFSVGIRF